MASWIRDRPASAAGTACRLQTTVALLCLLITGALSQAPANTIAPTPKGVPADGSVADVQSPPPSAAFKSFNPPPVRVMTAEEFEKEYGVTLSSGNSITVPTSSVPAKRPAKESEDDVQVGLIVGVVVSAALVAVVAAVIFIVYRRRGDTLDEGKGCRSAEDGGCWSTRPMPPDQAQEAPQPRRTRLEV